MRSGATLLAVSAFLAADDDIARGKGLRHACYDAGTKRVVLGAPDPPHTIGVLDLQEVLDDWGQNCQ